jgi:hypothetical protein
MTVGGGENGLVSEAGGLDFFSSFSGSRRGSVALVLAKSSLLQERRVEKSGSRNALWSNLMPTSLSQIHWRRRVICASLREDLNNCPARKW